MLKIVEIHTSRTVQGEYVVLQNQGVMNVCLKGWAICTDAYLDGDPAAIAEGMYVFRLDVIIKPYMRVVLFTGEGENGWVPTVEGKQAYCVYWGRQERIWANSRQVHALHLAASKRVVPERQAAAPVPSSSAYDYAG